MREIRAKVDRTLQKKIEGSMDEADSDLLEGIIQILLVKNHFSSHVKKKTISRPTAFGGTAFVLSLRRDRAERGAEKSMLSALRRRPGRIV